MNEEAVRERYAAGGSVGKEGVVLMDKFLMAVGTIVVVSIVAFGFSFLLAYPTMWMVNYLFTPATLLSLFGFAQLTFWKAFWLNFLCSQLFKGSSSSSSSKK